MTDYVIKKLIYTTIFILHVEDTVLNHSDVLQKCNKAKLVI